MLPIPQAYLDARVSAAVLALVNAVGTLGGFVSPSMFGILEQKTGSIQGGIYILAATSLLAAVLALWSRTKPSGVTSASPDCVTSGGLKEVKPTP